MHSSKGGIMVKYKLNGYYKDFSNKLLAKLK